MKSFIEPPFLKNSGKINNYVAAAIAQKEISDHNFDYPIEHSIKRIYKVSLNKLSITDEDCVKDPVVIIGPPVFTKLTGLEIKIQKEKGEYLLFKPMGITIYNFTKHALLTYQCDFDPATAEFIGERTCEYFYSDIVSFETISERRSLIDPNWKAKIIKKLPILESALDAKKKLQDIATQKFVLTTSSGLKISIPLSSPLIRGTTIEGKFIQSAFNKSMDVVRRSIRDKKQFTLNNSNNYC